MTLIVHLSLVISLTFIVMAVSVLLPYGTAQMDGMDLKAGSKVIVTVPEESEVPTPEAKSFFHSSKYMICPPRYFAESGDVEIFISPDVSMLHLVANFPSVDERVP